MMKRTQIYLEADTYKTLKTESKIEKKSLSQIIREAIGERLRTRSLRNKVPAATTLLKMARGAGRGPRDLSVNFDKYLVEALTEK